LTERVLDVVCLGIVVAFFGVCVLFVKVCAAIAGTGPAEVARAEGARTPVERERPA
jgi:hypothetical protein